MHERIVPLIAIAAMASACSEYEFHEPAGYLAGDEEEPVQDGGSWDDSREVVDVWKADDNDGSDLLFFGDTSGSMTEELQTLGSQMEGFIGRLEDFTDDWQLLAVTGPDGCGVGGVFTPDTPDYATQFASAILTPPGADLVDEWGLHNSTAAVELTDAGECNEGFLRSGALLHVVIISDEDDNSPGWGAGVDTYWRSYVDRIVAQKGTASLVRVSAVAGPMPDGCSGAEGGRGYDGAVDATGGEFISICSDWTEQLDLLVSVSVERADYDLSEVPIVDTIEVDVNGLHRKDGWVYQEEHNRVHFTDDVPVTGDRINISYMVDA